MGRRLVSDKVVSDDIVGTNGYHAPEVLFDDSYDIRADIFMLGVTFCVMVREIIKMVNPELWDDNFAVIQNVGLYLVPLSNLFHIVIPKFKCQ